MQKDMIDNTPPRFGNLIAVFAVMVLLIIGTISYIRYSDFIRNTASVAEQSVLGASSQITEGCR